MIARELARSAQFAVAELQHHIRRVTGVMLSSVSDDAEAEGTLILVGGSKATEALGLRNADFESQEYLIQPSKETLEPSVSIQMCLHTRNVYGRSLQENNLKILKAWAADSRERPKYLWLYYCFTTPDTMSQDGLGRWSWTNEVEERFRGA